MKKIAIAGSTGYLGKFLVEHLIESKTEGIALARNTKKLAAFNSENLQKVKAEFTQPESLNGLLNGVDTVISTVGITRQKDGLTYMDVDYQANKNLLNEARNAGVRKFIYVSVLNGQNMRQLKICDAKERFVDELKNSGIEYTIIRPSGFFSDMKDFLDMAKGGRVYLFGDGNKKLNPIHGADLAKVCFSAINTTDKEIEVGGPEILSHNEIAEMALRASGKKIKIVHLPDFLQKASIGFVRTFFSQKTYGPIEFFLTALDFDMVAPQFGTHKLNDFFSVSVQ
nr:SDR family oxidoreductase [uncultured Draconibacterium sp.]